MKRVAALLLLGSSLAACKKDPNDMALKDLQPRSGAVQAEQAITITGNFRDDIGYTVYFGPNRASRTSVRDPETLVAVCPAGKQPGPVDIIIMADNGLTYRMAQAYTYEGGGGNVMEQMGEGPQRQTGGGNLAY